MVGRLRLNSYLIGQVGLTVVAHHGTSGPLDALTQPTLTVMREPVQQPDSDVQVPFTSDLSRPANTRSRLTVTGRWAGVPERSAKPPVNQ